MKQVLLIFLAFLFLYSGNLFAGDKYNWPELVRKTIPESFKNEDAIYLENHTTIDFEQFDKTSVVRFKRIQILTKKGVEEFAERELYQFNDGKISLKKARVIKPSGEILELGEEHIIETKQEEKLRYTTDYLRRIQFIFPNLEPGDIIDVVYQADYDHYLLSNTIFLEDDLVSLNSRLTLRNMSMFELSIFPAKNMTDFTSGNANNIPSFSWTKTNVNRQSSGVFYAPEPNASKVTYTLWYPNKQLTYDEIYAFDLLDYSSQKGVTGIEKLLLADGVLTGTEDPFTGLIRLIGYLESDFTWIPARESSAEVKVPEYYERKVINSDLFFRYVQLFLEEQKISYKKAFTKSLQEGHFEHGYVSLDQLSERFLVLSDAEGNEHFLFAPASATRFYHLDEIPFYCEGNESIVLEGDRINLSNASAMQLPVSDHTTNKHTCNLLLKINPDDLSAIAAKRTDLFSGQYSYLLRGKDREEWLENFAVADTLLVPAEESGVYPYDVTFKQEPLLKELISPIDDSLYWLKPEKLLPEGLFFADEVDEETADYGLIPFLKQDKFSFYLESSRPVSLAETSKSITFSNETGSIRADVIQVNPTTLKFIYDVKLSKRLLTDRAQNQALHQLFIEWSSVRAKKWVIKFP